MLLLSMVRVSVESNVNTGNLTKDLEYVLTKAEDSDDFQAILNSALKILYRSLPDGEKNYGGKTPQIGTVRIDNFNYEHVPGNVNIAYIPSNEYTRKFGYVECKIGTINLRENKYSTKWSDFYNEECWHVSEVLMHDTEKVMESLGLKKEEKEKDEKMPVISEISEDIFCKL